MKKLKIFLFLFFIFIVAGAGGLIWKWNLNNKGGEKEMDTVFGSQGKVALVIAPQNFRDEELFHTQEELKKMGLETTVVSQRRGEIKGMLGGEAMAEKTIEEIDLSSYQALVFVGGTGASVYFNNEKVLDLARQAVAQGKVVGAICIAPSILANAGVLSGKKATAFVSEKENLVSHGAFWVEAPVVTDGKIVTASGPAAAREFGQTIARLVKE